MPIFAPRKGGNSETLCAEFTRGAEESGNVVEMVRLHGKKMGFCTACYACKKTGKCVQKDDVADILDKMAAADVIVLSTPVYFYQMNAQMKTLIDRMHTPLQESSKTADDGASAPREWCGCSGCMVHSGRRHGAHGRRAFPLSGNTFALAHGFTLDLDGVGVVDDPVTDGVGQGGVVQVLVPLAGVVLGAEDGGGHLAPGLY